MRDTIIIYTERLALELKTIGLINIQFAMKNEKSRLDFINDFLDSLSLTEKEVKNKKTILN